MDLFKLVREQIHSAPLFTQASTWDPESRRAYGQEQINQRYGVKNKAHRGSLPRHARLLQALRGGGEDPARPLGAALL